jgi:hypothetical protein
MMRWPTRIVVGGVVVVVLALGLLVALQSSHVADTSSSVKSADTMHGRANQDY